MTGTQSQQSQINLNFQRKNNPEFATPKLYEYGEI